MDFKRADKVGELIQVEISSLLLRRIKDPRIGMVTLTRVKVTDDLRIARVFYSVIGGDQEKKSSREGLESATGFIRRELGRRLRLRYTPELIFTFDDSLEYGNHIEQLLRGLKENDPSND
jgi:ribosome-binding factor A